MDTMSFTSSDEHFAELYDLLEAPPSASPLDLFYAYHKQIERLHSNDEITDQARIHIITLTTGAYELLCDKETKFKYDIVRMIRRGDLVLTKPTSDLPSLGVAATRVKIAIHQLNTTLHSLVEAYTDVEDASIDFEEDPYKPKYDAIPGKMWVFIAHVTLHLDACKRAEEAMNGMSEDEWHKGIRSSCSHVQIGLVCCARKAMTDLQVAEGHLHKRFWAQAAQALRSREGGNFVCEPDRLLGVLGRVRFDQDVEGDDGVVDEDRWAHGDES